jgi:thiol-disulfide isomerase/thioredoxin
MRKTIGNVVIGFTMFACQCLAADPVVIVHRGYETQVHTASKPDVMRYAVKLQAGHREMLASGVNVAGGIVTCAHVVDGFKTFTVDCDGERATATVARVDKEHDLAFMTVTWAKPHPVAVIATSGPAAKDTIQSAGRHRDGLLTLESHTYLRTENGEYLYSNPPQEGRSGSGIFNANGQLVGIVLGKIVDEEPFIGRSATVEQIRGIVGVGSSGLTWGTEYNAALLERSKAENRPILVMLTAKWCIPCKQLKQTLESMDLDGYLPILIDTDEQKNIAAAFGVTSIPVIQVVTPDAKLGKRLVGNQSAETLEKELTVSVTRSNR